MTILHKVIFTILVIIVVAGGILIFTGKRETVPVSATSTTGTAVARSASTEQAPTSANEKILVNLSVCKLQQDKVHLCPAEALANFGPVTIKNVGQTNTCRISYDRAGGYSFKGAVKSAQIPAGDFLVSVTDSGGIGNIVRNSNSLALTFFVGGSERVVNVMIVDGKDYSRDQCLDI